MANFPLSTVCVGTNDGIVRFGRVYFFIEWLMMIVEIFINGKI